jgi:hypothetical protein
MLQVSRPLSVTEILDGAFRIYRTHFTRLVLLTAVFLVPIAVATTLLLGFTVTGINDLFFTATSETDVGQLLPGFGAIFAYFVLGLLGYIATAVTSVSLLAYIVALLGGEQLTTGESIRRGLRRFWAFVGMAILAALAIGAAAFALYLVLILIFGAFAIFVGLLANLGESGGIAAIILALAAIFGFLAALFLIFVPIGLLSARWVAAPAAVVAEYLGPKAALDRSWALTRGQVWRCFGVIALLAILNFVVVGLPLSVLQMLLTFAVTSQWYGWLSGLIAGLTYFVNILWYPLMMLVAVLLYYDLRVRTEGLDLDQRIRQVEQATAALEAANVTPSPTSLDSAPVAGQDAPAPVPPAAPGAEQTSSPP